MTATTEKTMGKVIATITVTNALDDGNARSGLIAAEEVRSVTLNEVLVDTGATLLCLPTDVINQLGLTVLREVHVETAAGLQISRIFGNVRLAVQGREGTFDCLELPGGRDALLGVVPLEVLGLEPDVKNQRLKLLPLNETESYLTIL